MFNFPNPAVLIINNLI
uniref:Uncharacterized protein n=1 Tax=Anguilla anguilla TaxID=7936 RepID=A0A0E9Q7P7_ANGAN